MGNQMLVLLLAFLLWFCHGTPTAATPTCKAKERQALIELKAGLRDPSGRMSSWLGEDCCMWSGVACNNQTGHVIWLNLRNPSFSFDQTQALGGEINPSLAGLEHLRWLDLSGNFFWGVRVPPFIGTFKELRYLNLSFSGFSGTVPHQLGNLSSLRSLDLSYNDDYTPGLIVDGCHWLSQLSSLRYLDMSFVNLGKASNWLFNLTGLEFLYLRSNQFQGLLPDAIGDMTSLKELDLSGTLIGGSQPNLPSWLFNLTSLQYLGISMNGSISAALGNMTLLETLDLSGSNLEGSLPLTLGKLCRLRSLELSFCSITGTLDDCRGIFSGCIGNSLTKLDLSGTLIGGSKPNAPSWLFNLSSLQYLYISINGSIPTAIGDMTLLETLDLSGSNLEGSLPLTLGKLCRLRNLYLSACNITGTLDEFGGIFSGCIGNSLTDLDLSDNLFNGVLPVWPVNLKSLEYLDLSQNAIHGSIPTSVERLSSLQTLNLADNILNGTIPENLGKLSELKSLNLEDNMLHGTIPENLGKLHKLKILNLANNMLHGTIPENLGKLRELKILAVENNSLEGILSEAHFVDLTKLIWMDLSLNNLTIDVSSDWQPPFQLTNIWLQSCQLGPEFPAWILTQEYLYWVDLSHARMSGFVPDRFWNLTSNMIFLDLSDNNLSGTIALSELEAMSNLQFIDLSSNFFSGPLPSFFGPIPPGLLKKQFPLRYLSLSMNNINGTIPSNLCELENLEILALSNNQILGEIPHCLLQSSTLIILDISSNKISGMIPNSTSSASSLEQLNLNNNNLSGGLPYFLKSCQNMVILDLGHNKLSGKIPSWVGESLSSLRILSLRSNLFNGELPQTLHQLTTLQVLDLSHNHLSGTIPQSFGNFTAMKLVNMNLLNLSTRYDSYYAGNIILEDKGIDISFVDKQVSLVVAIDLSDNNLFGTIPKELADLHGLQILNVSGNSLSGRIMAKIGELRQLESLDLSSNQLSGGIPTSICSLSFLESLNLSYNNFSGRIPSGGQLNTFVDPTIYIGNHDFCGFPLTNNCAGDENRTIILDHARTKENEMLWFYSGIMAGFGLGFWGVWGILLVKRSWRYSYYQSIDNLHAAIRINFGKWK